MRQKEINFESLHDALPKEVKGERLSGKISFFNESAGFGFIQTSNESYFFHISNINGIIDKYDRVSFVVGMDRKQRQMAVDITRIG